MNYGYIYKITNNINGKIYIGQRKCRKDDMTEDEMLNDNYMGSGKILKQAIKKNGIENFTKEIICVCENKDDLNAMETLLILLAKAAYGNDCYNIAAGGHNNSLEYKTEEEMKEFSRKSSKNTKAMWAKRTEEEKAAIGTKIGKSQKKVWSNYTAEELAKISEQRSESSKAMWESKTEGEKVQTRAKQSESAIARWESYTEEKLEMISKNYSEAQKKIWEDPEAHKKASETAKKRQANYTEEEKKEIGRKVSEAHSNFINIYGVDKITGEKTEVFATEYEAKEFVRKKGYKTACIEKCLSGKMKTLYGYYWFGEKKNK